MDPERFSGFFSFAFPSLIRNFGYRRNSCAPVGAQAQAESFHSDFLK